MPPRKEKEIPKKYVDSEEEEETSQDTSVEESRVRKSKNFPDSKIFTAKTFRIKRVNCDIDDFATNARKN